jgi:hypothetical protein
MPTRLALLVPTALLGLLGCVDATAPLPVGARRMEPPAIYARWWRTVEQCSGLRGDLAGVQWYVVPATADPAARARFGGVSYEPAMQRVVLADSLRDRASFVRTLMLHTLLRDVSHPRALFLGSCAGIVECGERCLREAGPAPAPPVNAVRVESGALEVSVRAEPADTGVLEPGDFVEVIVTARNPASTPVVVQLAPSGDAGSPVSFGYVIGGESRGGTLGWWRDERADDASVATFAPGEVKRWIFDLRVGDGRDGETLPPGTYRVGGRFNSAFAAAPASLVVGR